MAKRRNNTNTHLSFIKPTVQGEVVMTQERQSAVTSFMEDTAVRRPELVNDDNEERLRREAADYQGRRNFLGDMAVHDVAAIRRADTPVHRAIVAENLIDKVEIMLPGDSEEERKRLVLDLVEKALAPAEIEVQAIANSKQEVDELEKQALAQRAEALAAENVALKKQMRYMSTEVMKALDGHPEAKIAAFTVIQNLASAAESFDTQEKSSPAERLKKVSRMAAAGIKSFFKDSPLPRVHRPSSKSDERPVESF